MKRTIEDELQLWKNDPFRMPLLVRGARQAGKSHTIEKFGKENFAQVVTVNFELQPLLIECFQDLDPKKIVRELELSLKVKIKPGSTLLFFDEIQFSPQAIVSLRYFKEKLPDLHLIAAGSLLEFALVDKNINFPVGRVQSVYMRPLSFLEFLEVVNEEGLVEFISNFEWTTKISQPVHERLMELVKIYFFTGGMPGTIIRYKETKSFTTCQNYLLNLINLYRSDMAKYATKTQYRNLQTLFDKAPETVGLRFKYTHVDPNTKSRDLQTALDQLSWAGLVTPVFASSATGAPLQHQIKSKVQKLLYLDIGMLQTALKVDPILFFREDLIMIHSGALAEQFVGQEFLAYANPHDRMQLYFWEREKRGSEAEVDYLLSVDGSIIPIEVKAGSTGRLRSLQIFLKEKNAPYGIQICSAKPEKKENVFTLPFYLISQIQRLFTQKT
ncbi:MAG: ATP-binding protein [Candidatus Algichlamydia australiensis]|nr:ATP-binding protein [Chlamydiales bacterium]